MGVVQRSKVEPVAYGMDVAFHLRPRQGRGGGGDRFEALTTGQGRTFCAPLVIQKSSTAAVHW